MNMRRSIVGLALGAVVSLILLSGAPAQRPGPRSTPPVISEKPTGPAVVVTASRWAGLSASIRRVWSWRAAAVGKAARYITAGRPASEGFDVRHDRHEPGALGAAHF